MPHDMQQHHTPHIIELPKNNDPRGNLSFLQDFSQMPFAIERCYWLYDVPGNATRDGHAYHTSQEIIIALSGSFDVVLDDGHGHRERHHMNRSYRAVYVPPMWWRELDNFSTNSVALVLSSTLFSENEYIRDYELFKQLAANKPSSI